MMTFRLSARALFPALAALAGLACAGQAAAQDMKPGLWEQTNNVSSTDAQTQAAIGEVRKQLGNMSSDQRQSLQQMLANHGVQVDLNAGGALRSRMCLTREMIERKEVPLQEGNCTHKLTPLGANRLQVSFSCSRPRASGEGEMTVDTPTSYHARMHIRDEGQAQRNVDMDVSGRWLAADCGNVRPLKLPQGQP